MDAAVRLAVTRAVGWPRSSAMARHSSARRLLPTPAGPRSATPSAVRSARASVNVSSASLRPVRGHCCRAFVLPRALVSVPPPAGAGGRRDATCRANDLRPGHPPLVGVLLPPGRGRPDDQTMSTTPMLRTALAGIAL